jgi:hypothetical protein
VIVAVAVAGDEQILFCSDWEGTDAVVLLLLLLLLPSPSKDIVCAMRSPTDKVFDMFDVFNN